MYRNIRGSSEFKVGCVVLFAMIVLAIMMIPIKKQRDWLMLSWMVAAWATLFFIPWLRYIRRERELEAQKRLKENQAP